MAKVQPKGKTQVTAKQRNAAQTVAPRHVSVMEDPFTGRVVAHSGAYWQQRANNYIKQYGPLDITAPMGPADVAHSIDAATRQKFGPQYQTLSGMKQQSLAEDKNVSDWYGQYKQALANATQQTQAANQAAMNFTNNFANTSSQVDAGQRAQLASQQQASAAQRGQSVDPNQGLVGQQADQSRRASAGAFGSLIGAQGANATGFLANRGVTSAGQEIQAHTAEANRRQNIAQQVRQTQAQEGDYRTTLRGQLQASERQNQLARATFGLNQAKAASDAATAAQRLAVTQRGQDVTARGQNLSHQDKQASNQTTQRGQDISAQTQRRGQDLASQRAAARKRAAAKPYHGHDKAYQTAYTNVYKYLFTTPAWRQGGWGHDRNSIIAGVRKVTGAPYGPAADAVDAIMKKYPILPTPSAKLT